MWEKLTDEAFMKPAAAVIALIIFLLALRKINKILFFVGIVAVLVIYLLNSPPQWFQNTLDYLDPWKGLR
jgi:hypothetical protein